MDFRTGNTFANRAIPNRPHLFLLGLLYFLCLPFSIQSQTRLVDYVGTWEGSAVPQTALNLDIKIEERDTGTVLSIGNTSEIYRKNFDFGTTFNIPIFGNAVFKGRTTTDGNTIKGFIQLAKDLYPVVLTKKGKDYFGKWNLAALPYLQSGNCRLAIKEVDDGGYDAYPMMGTFWVADYELQDNKIAFRDFKTGLNFKGTLESEQIKLQLFIGKTFVASLDYFREGSKTSGFKGTIEPMDGLEIAQSPLKMDDMETAIADGTLEGTEGVVVYQDGQIVYEAYFNGFGANTPHDMRSAGKSFGSAIIGLAVDQGIIKGVAQKVSESLAEGFGTQLDPDKETLNLKQLLTMSSGIGVNEDTYQESGNWLKTVLEEPLSFPPGKRTIYKSADPFLTGVFLNSFLKQPMEFFILEHFMEPLGITIFIMNTDDRGIPYFGGGIFLTPRDMVKMGVLYLNKGIWQGQRILSEAWVTDSFKKHTHLENVGDKNGYGYFWWHHDYSVNGRSVASVEARGNGGQYIFVLPELRAVVAITSGNYRNGKFRQPEQILEHYILPELVD